MDKESSDEKLLKLIEGTAKRAPLAHVGIKFKDNKFKIFRLLPELKITFNLYTLNKTLFIIGVLLSLLFLYYFLNGSRALDADLLFSAAEKSPLIKKYQIENAEFLSIQEYLSIFANRNIFIPAGKKTTDSGEQQDLAKLEELAKNLKLVGIVWSASPEAMIEDAQDARTYLLKKGEIIGKNNFKIKDITQKSVILEIDLGDDKKEYELR